MHIFNSYIVSLIVACCMLLITQGANGQNKGDQRNQWIKQSSFIFSGTVAEMEASSVKGIKSAGNTVVIKADSVHLKPDAVVMPESRAITVLVKSPQTFEEGLDVTMYSNIKQIGNREIAATEVGHERTKDTPQFKDLGRERENLLLRDHIRQAELVAVGQVMNIRSEGSEGKESEHDPQWKEALIELGDIYKGTDEPNRIVARFPASMDVSWYEIPKLEEGQSAVFILKRSEQQTTKVDQEALLLYQVRDPMDIWSSREADRIQALMK